MPRKERVGRSGWRLGDRLEWRSKEGLGVAAHLGQGDRWFRGEGGRLRGEREKVDLRECYGTGRREIVNVVNKG